MLGFRGRTEKLPWLLDSTSKKETPWTQQTELTDHPLHAETHTLLYQGCVEGGEELVESLWRVVVRPVRIAEPLERRDADGPVKSARPESKPLPHVPQEQISLHFALLGHSYKKISI